MNKMHLIMALKMESQGLFEAAGVPVHFCEIGKVNAAAKTAELIFKEKVTHILNLGTAGSHVFPAHSLVECSAFVQRDMDLSPLGFPRGQTPMDSIQGKIEVSHFLTDLPRGVCGTGDSFEIGPPKLACDLVDMEAYAMAKVCARHGVKFSSIKYITDGSDSNAHKDWRENLLASAKALLKVYQELKFITQGETS